MHQFLLLVPAASSQFISQSLEKLEETEAMDRNMNLSIPDFLCWKRLHGLQRHVNQGKGSEHICDWNKPKEVQFGSELCQFCLNLSLQNTDGNLEDNGYVDSHYLSRQTRVLTGSGWHQLGAERVQEILLHTNQG